MSGLTIYGSRQYRGHDQRGLTHHRLNKSCEDAGSSIASSFGHRPAHEPELVVIVSKAFQSLRISVRLVEDAVHVRCPCALLLPAHPNVEEEVGIQTVHFVAHVSRSGDPVVED